MNRLRGLTLAAVLAASGGVHARDEGGAGTAEQPTNDCTYWISTAPTFQACISTNGTLDFLQFGTPGREFVSGDHEGHVLCYLGGSYYDKFSDGLEESGWAGPGPRLPGRMPTLSFSARRRTADSL